jgi:Lrp/AsnC family transcriptional regulator for asnA, asnC and gidA
MVRRIDDLDRQLIALLNDEGRLPLSEVAQRAGVSRPTVAARLKTLLRGGLLKVAGLINVVELRGITIGLVGLTLDAYTLEEKLEQIGDLAEVNWAAVVTGRYDIICEVATEEGMAGLYRFLTESLVRVGGISSSEMFVVMRARNKWTTLPPGMRSAWTRGQSDEG